jgi:D-alanine-D-alanine ligase-like ATP-grasp enzyme
VELNRLNPILAEAEQLELEREEFIKQEEFRIGEIYNPQPPQIYPPLKAPTKSRIETTADSWLDLSTQVRKNNKIAEDIAISSEGNIS